MSSRAGVVTLSSLAILAIVAALAVGSAPPRLRAQDAADLRRHHQTAVHATVRIDTRRAAGSGWLLAQNTGLPVVVTNRHVAESALRGAVRVEYYRGASERSQVDDARVVWISDRIDLAVIRLEAAPPATSRGLELEPGDVVRGQRIIVAGNPRGLTFQTTEGVVTGALPEGDPAAATCGAGRNCVVVDAASFAGSSGGPAINDQGRLVGMLWGGPRVEGGIEIRGLRIPMWAENPTFAFLVHVRTIEAELRRRGEMVRSTRERAD